MYLFAILSTISQAASPSIHPTTRPRTTTGVKGSSAAMSDSATRGSRRKFLAFTDVGPVKNAIRSPSAPTKTGTECGDPSGRTVARWATAVVPSRRRTSGSSMVPLDSVAQMGDTRRGYHLNQLQADIGGQVAEETAAGAEEHRDLVQDHLVEQPGAQRGRGDAAAHDRDVLAARHRAGGLDSGFN